MIQKRTLLVITVAAVAVAATVWVSFLQKEQKPEALNLVLGVELSLLTAPVWIAEYNGYFQKNNLNLEIRGFTSGKASLAAMLKGERLDVITVAQTPIMFNSFKTDSFAIVATMVTSYSDMKLIVNSDSGINSTLDLKGKKVGLTNGSTGEYFFSLVLLDSAVEPSTVEVIDIAPSGLPLALKEGLVDAICTWEPHAINAKRLIGDKASALKTSDKLYREDFYFVANKHVLEVSPQAFIRFLSAIEEAEAFIHSNREEAKGIVSKRLNLDRVFVDALWDEFNYQLSLDQTVFLTLEDEARWAIANGLTDATQIPNYLNYINTGPLKKANPGAVKIY
ncbi:ABC-type nitrate/sulfonate/bicarbonate transport system, substrate-binding protein [Mariprofundus aestuarium]|uniref:ABC-type nitrate/sulfonate/bicarbonate transport system, substrate-binding protein n=1 Tax=Mariprofundus aestuarium TaxID=1921086 RepID=A0A2K8KWM7_MARES|nr:ABC transporter substrate-binding protein [Mariprofundus aestuarium]ATX79277.1 ABC-type nitrate/sulfonate/bicarbonate transport system, substrate-binding protein [Mariprofundus aestuarium]